MDYENIMNFNNKCSITFIGMPGTGKSFTSKILSEKYNIPVIELDTIIENNYKMPLQDIINKYGEKEFKTIEKNAILNIKFNKPVLISPGGSIIYCEQGMNHLVNNKNLIIYLKTDYDILKKRTENFTNRGIIFNGQTPEELYNNRDILYKKYANVTLNLSKKNKNEICKLFNFLS